MKSARSSAISLLLIICTLLIANPGETYARAADGGGRLIIGRSPVLGVNVSIVIYIDGQIAGTLVRARTFDSYIAPGRHVVVASPNKLRGDWRGILDVRPGHTYVYIAHYNLTRLVLYPARAHPYTSSY